MCAAHLEDSTVLTAGDGPPVEVVNPGGRGPAVVVCEHAAHAIPARLGDLGLAPEARRSHIAWDPGALAVARRLAARLDAALVAARFSRLVFDVNRPAGRADAMPEQSEIFEVPGNRGLEQRARAARAAEIAEPFHAALAATLAARRGGGGPALVTVHSFTPVYFGARREVELGLLHDADARLADWLLPRAAAATGLVTRRNEPYGPADGVTHTLRLHGLPAGLPNIMLEIRNDLIADAGAQARVAEALAGLLAEGIAALVPGGTG